MSGNKRGRRGSVSVSEESVSEEVTDYNEDSFQSATSSVSTRKKRRLVNSKLQVIHCQEILDKLRNVKGDDGHLLTDSFMRLPKKRSASDYYDVITSPIDLSKIQTRITNNEYLSFLDFEIDIEQLVDNAKMYHTSSAVEYQDAVALWSIYEQEKQNIATILTVKEESIGHGATSWSHSGSESRSRRGRKRIAISIDDGLSDQISLATSDDSRNTSEVSSISDNPLEVLFTSIVLQKTDVGKDITPTFTFLPSKQTYPQYYEVIKDPIDLRIIAQKIKNGTYTGVEDLERDFQVMIKNAKTFNEPKSEVYQDAVELQKIVKTKRNEFDPGEKPQRKRGRKRKIPSNITDKFAQMILPKDSDDESEEHGNDLEDSVEVEKDLDIDPNDVERSLQWQLYKSVTSVTFNNGSNPTGPFMKLPSKKVYPDYYLEIMNPMSLLMVKAKIKDNLYNNVDEALRDLNLVFNNAQQFNVEGSGIYKDAVKLQNLANMKRNEMLNSSIQYSHDIPTKKASFTKSNSTTPNSTPRRSRPPSSPEEMRIKRINSLFQTIYTYQEENRFLRDIFMNLPSKEEYPSYYQVIPNPIDLSIIRKKIDDNKYVGHLDLAEDLKLMFSNAKHFNEESSQIYKDTLTLERLLKKKIKNFGVVAAAVARGLKKKNEALNSVSSISSPIFIPPVIPHTPQNRIKEIFQTIKDYRDNSGRLLSEPFVKLPSKQDMPEYYEYIKKPIELQTIQFRINNDKYQTVENLMEDLFLMFDNACKFNEPDSQIYRDALILLRVSLEKKAYLTSDDNISEPPNVQTITHDIMLSMYKEFLNSIDEDGRYLIDSLREINGDLITRKPFGRNPNVRIEPICESTRLNLDVIKHDVEKGRYKRMDRLQEDVFAYLRHVRKVTSIYSQAYEDSCKLQKCFVIIMESRCERGEVLLTPALNYNERYLTQEIELEAKGRKESDLPEVLDDDHEFLTNIIKEGSYRMLDSVTRQDNNFQIGDFVRIQKEPGEIPRVGEICAVLVPNSDDIHSEDSKSDGSLIRVNWYYYPQQTIHKSTKRLTEREIYQTSVYETVPLNKIVSKCLVMYIKDYMKQTSKMFKENDIFVCESIYSVKDNSFKKIKKVNYKNRLITENFVNREESIFLTRNFSTFVSEVVKFELNDFSFTLENVKESVLQEDRTAIESCVYYDQFVCANGFSVKVGDYVYVNDEANRTQIVRIDQLWNNTLQNIVYFSGPWFINAMDVDHLPTRMFYRKEVFLSSLEGSTHLLTTIIGKCVILSFSDYCKYRPTEYLDDDIFACQFKYFIDEKIPRKLKKGLKKAQLSTKALDDEIYFFKKELIPNKETSSMLAKCSSEPIKQEYISRMLFMSQGPILQYIDEDSKDTTTTLDDSMCSMSVASSSNNGSEKKQKKKKGTTPPSGYVLYAAEIRKKLLKDNPKTEFGLLSKEVGQMWRNIPQSDKDVYERRALEIKQAMDKDTAISSEMEIRQKEALLKQQSQIAAQQMYVASPPVQNQRNFIQVPPSNQQMLASAAPPNFQNNTGPIQYFQTPNGQVLQFMPSTNVQTNTAAHFTNAGGEPQLQFIPQANQPSQQVIYQIAPQSQTNQQQMIGNQAQFSNAQLMMHQNKMNNFQPSPQHNAPMQNMQNMQNMPNINFNQIPQNQIFPGFPNHPTNIPANIPLHQNFNVQNPTVTVTQPPQHFVSVASRSARVLHSDIYQKYIEKLRKNSSTLSDWKQQLEFSKETVLAAQGNNRQAYVNKLCQDVAPGFLDSKLMIDKEGKKLNQEAIIDSLFQLRDHMLQDAMNIRTRILGLGEL